jgi:hypothetical protein
VNNNNVVNNTKTSPNMATFEAAMQLRHPSVWRLDLLALEWNPHRLLAIWRLDLLAIEWGPP